MSRDLVCANISVFLLFMLIIIKVIISTIGTRSLVNITLLSHTL